MMVSQKIDQKILFSKVNIILIGDVTLSNIPPAGAAAVLKIQNSPGKVLITA